jgi:hypothetical protein
MLFYIHNRPYSSHRTTEYHRGDFHRELHPTTAMKIRNIQKIQTSMPRILSIQLLNLVF